MHEQSVMSKRETLQEITCCLERFKSAFPRHNVVLGADCNVSLNGFEDGGFVGDARLRDKSWMAAREQGGSLQKKRRFWMFGSTLRCDSDHLAVVGTYQTVRNVGVSGAGKKKRIPYALRWTANDPVAWEKAVGGSGEFGADWRDPLAFLGFLARTADAHKTRQKCEKDQVICDLKAQLQCATTAIERRRCNCLLWCSTETSGFSAGSMRGETFSSATEAWQSLQLAESFGARTSVVGHQKFLR